jgi:hypothetical protein
MSRAGQSTGGKNTDSIMFVAVFIFFGLVLYIIWCVVSLICRAVAVCFAWLCAAVSNDAPTAEDELPAADIYVVHIDDIPVIE